MAKKISKKKQKEINAAIFADLTETGKIYPKKGDKRVKPKTKKKKK